MISPASALRMKVLQSRGPPQGRSVRSLPSRIWHTGPFPKQSGSRYETQASPRLKGTSTLQGCWEQPAASEGRLQAPPATDLSSSSLSLSLSLLLRGWGAGPSLSLSLSFARAMGTGVAPCASLSLSFFRQGQGQESLEACPDPPGSSAHPRFLGVSRFPLATVLERESPVWTAI